MKQKPQDQNGEQLLYLLPFDHHRSFLQLLGLPEPLRKKDILKIKEYKQIIYSAFRRAISQGLPKNNAGILVDEAYGKDILLDAKKRGFITAYTLEKSGRQEFMFDRADYKKRLNLFQPTYAKVLIRYNPEGNKEINRRQAGKLALLTAYLQTQHLGFLLEVLVPATELQLRKARSKKNYESQYRPSLMAKAVKELQSAGVNPEIWKLEGVDKRKELEKIVRLIHPESKVIILGRGESRKKAENWLKVGSQVNRVIGFAVGRTIFQQPLLDHQNKKINKQQAINAIMRNYLHFVKIFERSRKLKK